MELKVHEDTKETSECRLKFHFIFDMIRKQKSEELKEFDWDISSNPIQRLYLSKDTTRMMEVINNQIATVYYRVNFFSEGTDVILDQNLSTPQDHQTLDNKCQDHGQEVKWRVDFRIRCFPKTLAQITSVPYLFSPNFTY